jgi:hypothetical protein
LRSAGCAGQRIHPEPNPSATTILSRIPTDRRLRTFARPIYRAMVPNAVCAPHSRSITAS